MFRDSEKDLERSGYAVFSLKFLCRIKDLQNNDPYSHLRYNPHWRNDAGRTAEQEDSINAETRLSQRWLLLPTYCN